MEEKAKLESLNKKQLIEVIDSYKEKLASMEEYMKMMRQDNF